MNLITWNVNGLRSVMGKGFPDFVNAEKPDFLLLQETKVDPATVDFGWLPGYHRFWNRAAKPGYSGTGILTKHAPLSVLNGIGLRLAQERVDLALAGYQAGKADLAALLNVRRELLESRLRSIDLDAQRADLRARLNNLVAEGAP